MFPILVAIIASIIIGFFSTYLTPLSQGTSTSQAKLATEDSIKPRKYFSPAPIITI